jgi:hypothetical protein
MSPILVEPFVKVCRGGQLWTTRNRAIRDALTQGYSGQPTGIVARHLTTLAAFISGIVGSKSTQLPSGATKIPNDTKSESRVKRVTRWLDMDDLFRFVGRKREIEKRHSSS